MKRRPVYTLLIAVLLLSLILSACKKSEPKPQVTGTPTSVPTASVVPTITPIPPTPTALPEYQPPPAGMVPPYILQRSP
jgi:hypothetical protein